MRQRPPVNEPPIQTEVAWAPPAVSLEPGRIVCDYSQRVSRRTGQDLLREFVRLPESDDAAVFKYARRWGGLALSRDGWPLGNRAGVRYEGSFPLTLVPQGTEPGLEALAENCYVEPIATWRSVARRFRAAIHLAAEFGQGRTGLVGDWEDLQISCLEEPVKLSE
jgi:hypothetical protein